MYPSQTLHFIDLLEAIVMILNIQGQPTVKYGHVVHSEHVTAMVSIDGILTF